MHGALLLFVSTDVRRHLPVIKFLAYAGLVFGLAMIPVDLHARLPLLWVVCEGPYIIVLSGLVLLLSSKLKGNAPPNAGVRG
jgi:hypothetical protein